MVDDAERAFRLGQDRQAVHLQLGPGAQPQGQGIGLDRRLIHAFIAQPPLDDGIDRQIVADLHRIARLGQRRTCDGDRRRERGRREQVLDVHLSLLMNP